MQQFISNWKTTVAGIVTLVLPIAVSLHWITADVANTITAVAVALGLIHAQDSGNN